MHGDLSVLNEYVIQEPPALVIPGAVIADEVRARRGSHLRSLQATP